MRISFKTALAIFAVCTISQRLPASEPMDSNQLLQPIFEAIKARDLLLQSYNASISITKYKSEAMRKENSPLGDESINVVKSGIKEKIEITSKFVSGNGTTEAVMWNGKFGKTWIKGIKDPGPGSGRVVIEPPSYISNKLAERYVSSSFSAKSWAQILEDGRKLAPKIDVEGNRTRIIVESGCDDDLTILTMWFDNDKLFAPSAWRQESREKGKKAKLIAEYIVEEFTEAGGLWLPKTLVRKTWDGNIEVAKLTVDLNTGVNNDLDIKWPSGASIWDAMANRGFIVP